jgi:hypothetical protein
LWVLINKIMSVIPAGYTAGTSLNPSITTYEELSIRLQRLLGAPLINLEISDTQIYDCITHAIEYYTKWSGYTEEYLVFNSRLYVSGVGIKVDDLINATSEMYKSQVAGLSAGYDYDLASYRKVIDCFEFSKGESTGINTLFTLEQALAQQIYSSYMVGTSFGFDLVTWESLKQFIDTRNRSLALIPHFRFNPDEQILQIIPEPTVRTSYLGVVGCYIEKPIKHVIKQKTVHRLSMAYVKIAIGRTREKFPGTNMMGGGSVSTSLLQEGLAEADKIEQEIREGFYDNAPAQFFTG